MGGHGIELGVQLVYLLTKNLICLGLGGYKALHKVFQVRLGLWGRWIVGCPTLKTRGLRGIGWQGVVVPAGEVRMISPTGVVCG